MNTCRWVLVAVAMLVAAGVSLGAGAANANETRKLLSSHQTVAKLGKIAYQECRGLTSLCPNDCGDSGDYATFEIVGYIAYEKAGEYGDPKGESFTFQIEDNHKKLKVSKELADTVRGLKEGDYVLLDWNHNYVTRKEAGGSSSFPERVITKLEKVTKEAGEAKLKDLGQK